ncbi:MAG: DUF4236 domain-containing protein [Staphylococcus sp.]|nr:DUF4236 domain-containing protein [Staphylococcus sp.]
MAIKFRKTKKILPGVKLNISKSGVSVTTGIKGASINIGKNGVYRNLGIPGTGISKRDKLEFSSSKEEDYCYLDVLIDYVVDGQVATLNVAITDYYPEKNAIWGYCEELEQEAVFYLSDIQRVFDIKSGKDVGDIAEYFSQLNQSEDKKKSNNPPIGKILVVAFILFFIAYTFLFTKS